VTEIPSKRFALDALRSAEPGTLVREPLLPGQLPEVRTELVSIRGPFEGTEQPAGDVYVLLIGLAGTGAVRSGGASFELVAESLARPPHGKAYEIRVADAAELHVLHVTKSLDETDRKVIADGPADHAELFACRFADGPTYSEGIKSARTVNRTLLPEGKVPRFCLGSVKTTGPDQVARHKHPMLEQLFLGLRDCRCTVHADDASALLTGNTLLHIPLGSDHAVTVAEGDTLDYLWFDFFHTLADQSWIRDQHITNDE